MSDIREYISSKIKTNYLPLNVDNVLSDIEKFKKLGTYSSFTDNQLFYQYILNKCGKIIADINIDVAECFGYLKPKQSFNHEIVYYEFFTEEDYFDWLASRKEIYSNINNIDDLRLLNYLELCTIDFIRDIITECEYEIYDKDLTVVKFKKEKFGVSVETPLSFIKYLATYFRKNMVFKPI